MVPAPQSGEPQYYSGNSWNQAPQGMQYMPADPYQGYQGYQSYQGYSGNQSPYYYYGPGNQLPPLAPIHDPQKSKLSYKAETPCCNPGVFRLYICDITVTVRMIRWVHQKQRGNASETFSKKCR